MSAAPLGPRRCTMKNMREETERKKSYLRNPFVVGHKSWSVVRVRGSLRLRWREETSSKTRRKHKNLEHKIIRIFNTRRSTDVSNVVHTLWSLSSEAFLMPAHAHLQQPTETVLFFPKANHKKNNLNSDNGAGSRRAVPLRATPCPT